jgi:hypothetical protein
MNYGYAHSSTIALVNGAAGYAPPAVMPVSG